jgi:hypothetical protein
VLVVMRHHEADMTMVEPEEHDRQRGAGRILTLLSGIGALVAVAAMLVFVLRMDESVATGTDVLPAAKLTVGLQDERLPTAPVGELPARLDRLKVSGAKVTRVDVLWAQIAPSKPAKPDDPADSAYQWGRTDAIIDGLRDRDISVIVSFSQTPGWSNGNKTPEWIGSTDDYGAFVRAFATRYSGTDHGAVAIYEPWSEPNNAAMLMPQWAGAGSAATPVSPAAYAKLFERARTEIAGASPSAAVAGLALADIEVSTAGVGGVGVADFVRALAGSAPSMTLVSQHLSPVEAPTAATTRIPSVAAIAKYVDLIDTVAPNAAVLVTAVGYTTPPGGMSEASQAGSIATTMASLAADPRVRLAVWYSMQDTLERPSGLVRIDGSEKPAWKAFLDTPKTYRSGQTP